MTGKILRSLSLHTVMKLPGRKMRKTQVGLTSVIAPRMRRVSIEFVSVIVAVKELNFVMFKSKTKTYV